MAITALPRFTRYFGIDYSGATTPDAGQKGLRVYEASRSGSPTEIPPPPSPKRYWTRRGLAHWLAEQLRNGPPTLVGIDHAFSFPIRYFEVHGLPPDWPGFLVDFRKHWPTDEDHCYVDFVRDGLRGNGAARQGSPRWRRLTELRAGAAKSVFHFDVPGQVAKSTHAGLPWLLYLRGELHDQSGPQVHFWPFDGWTPPPGRSVLVEAYPALYSRSFPREDRNPDQHDAYSIAEWMRRTDRAGELASFFGPELAEAEGATAGVEGWILGVR